MTNYNLIVATGNAGKKRELERLLEDFCAPFDGVYDLKSWPGEIPEVVEDADTFEGNAMKKALQTAMHTGSCTISDDSGLEVDALNNRPGIYSARFAGEAATDAQNNQKLIAELKALDLPEESYTARFVAIICLVLVDNEMGNYWLSRCGLTFDAIAPGMPSAQGKWGKVDNYAILWFRGEVDGIIVGEPRGNNGFGYDPHFLIPQWQKTLAEVSIEAKSSISHRARAAEKLAAYFDASTYQPKPG